MKKTFSILALIFAILATIGGLCFIISLIVGFANPANVEFVAAFISGSLIATLLCWAFFEFFQAMSKMEV